jgi:co-chaperonin GroES (HSP10)
MIERINGIDSTVGIQTQNEKLAKSITGLESGGLQFAVNAQSLEDLAKTEAASKFNNQVDEYVEKLDKHAQLLEQYKELLASDLSKIELKPLYEGILIKPFEENPFQRIKKEGNIIVDLGGQRPVYKSHETGEYEEEEQFIHVGTVIEAGPMAKYIQEGDVVMWRKPSETPIPFYKQGFVLVNEHSIIAVANEGLTERFKNL